jgi:hypothetical protein
VSQAWIRAQGGQERLLEAVVRIDRPDARHQEAVDECPMLVEEDLEGRRRIRSLHADETLGRPDP